MRLLACLLVLNFTCTAQRILVNPYIQPGNAPGLDYEEKVLIWQTDSIPSQFTVEYGKSSGEFTAAKVQSTNLYVGNRHFILYKAILPSLEFDETYHYRVSTTSQSITKGEFKTRSKKSSSRFVVFGDCGAGSPGEAAVAYQVYSAKPEFVLIAGDNVYSRGRVSEYLDRYFPFYNRQDPDPLKGVPVMQSIPFYVVVGNHDVGGANLGMFPDGLAYYYYFDLPLNGPIIKNTVTAIGSAGRLDTFNRASGSRFPRMSNFSFDHGNVHITCLDSNPYIDVNEPALISWIENDLRNSKATWKIVTFHHPGFNSSNAHYDAQWMRALAPVFERSGVDLVMNGHVHNYQRSYPLRFEPAKDSIGRPRVQANGRGRVDGAFTLDKKFNGRKKNKPKGIVYVVSGSAGAGLYDTTFTDKPERWVHAPKENWVPFTVKLISDVHSFTLIETNDNKLTLRQIEATGKELDKIEMKK